MSLFQNAFTVFEILLHHVNFASDIIFVIQSNQIHVFTNKWPPAECSESLSSLYPQCTGEIKVERCGESYKASARFMFAGGYKDTEDWKSCKKESDYWTLIRESSKDCLYRAMCGDTGTFAPTSLAYYISLASVVVFSISTIAQWLLLAISSGESMLGNTLLTDLGLLVADEGFFKRRNSFQNLMINRMSGWFFVMLEDIPQIIASFYWSKEQGYFIWWSLACLISSVVSVLTNVYKFIHPNDEDSSFISRDSNGEDGFGREMTDYNHR